MKVFAISDLHLSFDSNKPMDVFGVHWDNYLEKIEKSWNERVTEEDIVLVCGDLSWGLKLENALRDIDFLAKQKGTKIIVRGNHDYWWQSISKVRAVLPKGIIALQNDCFKIGNKIFCGTRGWTVENINNFTDEDKKLYLRETERLSLSLKQMEKVRCDGDMVYVLLHYPPFNVKRDNSNFMSLCLEHNVNKVIYGHLHGSECRAELKVSRFEIDYFLTSCDILNFELVEIG